MITAKKAQPRLAQNSVGPTARNGLKPPEKQRVDEPRETTPAARFADPMARLS
jgi:hypothetical protein